jgi:hypothetical protein
MQKLSRLSIKKVSTPKERIGDNSKSINSKTLAQNDSLLSICCLGNILK